jgi:hypothetical protein
MGNDIMRSAYKVEPKYRVTREDWTKRPGSPPVVKGFVLYPHGSKTKRVAGAGVYGQSFGRSISISISVGKYVIVFQVKIYAILACVYEIQTTVR